MNSFGRLLIVPVLLCSPSSSRVDAADLPLPVECVVLNESNWDASVPKGKEVDAIYGDIVLRNGHLTAVIAQPVATRHANMTVHDVAGCLIDLTSREFESDQLSAFYPGDKSYPFRKWSVVDASGVPQDVDAETAEKGATIAVRVSADAGERRPAVTVTYRMTAGSPFLDIDTEYTNDTDRNLTVSLVDSLRIDGGKEQMSKSTNGVHDLFTVDDRYWQQAYGMAVSNRRIQSQSSSRSSKLKFLELDEDESRVKLLAGESFTLKRRVTAGRTLMDVRAAFDAMEGLQVVPVMLTIVDHSGRAVQDTEIEIRSAGGSHGFARGDDRGSATFPLSPKTYSVRVSVNGHIIEEDRALFVNDAVRQEESIVVDSYRPGTLIAKIVDEDGKGIPCKVELLPQGDVPTPDFGPESADFAVRNLRYAPHGEFQQDLHPGTYDVIVSHGPEYDALFTEVIVKPGEKAKLNGTLVRSVDTTGWISTDYHSHSSPSGDNTGSQLGRVLNLVCEHIEYAPCTEHNRIDTYMPHIKALKIGRFMGTSTGMELTGKPLPLNHQNVFPLHHHPHKQDGGGPVTDGSPETQIERLALWDNRSEKLIQQNHPDLGWLFFDKDGDQQPDEGHPRSFGLMDVIEIHPIDTMLRRKPFIGSAEKPRNNRMFNWLQLLNQGHHIPGVVNTDAHYNYHGSGWIRNWVESPTDNPARIKTLDVVHASEHGHLVMSNGPFLQVWAKSSGSDSGSNETLTAGDDLTAKNGQVELRIKVQCPNWHDINRVFVLINGRLDEPHDFTRESHADRFTEGTVKFDQTIKLELKHDSHLIVVAGGQNLKLGPVVGPAFANTEPTAVANPVFVDVDGDGFKPNQDTLDHSLPVKRN